MENDQLVAARCHVAERGVSVMELAGLVEKLKGKVPLAEIRSLYACWIEHHPADPMLYAVLFNYSVVLTDAGDLIRRANVWSGCFRSTPISCPP